MFSTALIVFREVLEAALIIGIVMAATRGVAGRGLWVTAGVGAGLVGATLVAASAEAISSALEGMGQEFFNAAVLFTAAAMLGWHNVWMQRHGREIAAHVGGVGRSVADGASPLYALAIVVGVAVLREGSELVLFLHGILAAQGIEAWGMLVGGIAGVGAAAILGLVLYLGLLRIPSRYLFSVTGWLILLLAAGMAAQGAGFLVQADVLPSLGTAVWDTSSLLSEQSILGQLLSTLVGYIARPDGVQILFYLSTLVIIAGAMRWVNGQSPRPVPARAPLVSVLALAVALTMGGGAPDASADYKVYSPIVEKGELELEARGHVVQDGNEEEDGARQDKYEIGYGFTDWWFSSVFGEYEKEPDENYEHAATAWENIFQLTDQGKYWLDAGLYVEYEVPRDRDEPDKLELKLLLEKNVGRWTHTANLIAEREVGGGSDDDVETGYAWRTKFRWIPQLEPAIELYGDLGHTGNFGIHDDESHVIGPVLLGTFQLTQKVALAYEVGELFGLTSDSPDRSFKWLVELEARF